MPTDILYCGDTSLTTAACYLAGLLRHSGWSFAYVPSDRPCGPDLLAENHRLYVVSDYPAERMPIETQRTILDRVANGAGLLMIGGWESYQGSAGRWHGTPLAEALPVVISAEDDRRNCDGPVFVGLERNHPIVAGLPWRDRPPLIGGYNAVSVKPAGELILSARRFRAAITDAGPPSLHPVSTEPLLAVGSYGQGRTAALTTDLAPHWVGPMVDWGPSRVSAQAPQAEAIEVGDLYARFVRQLVGWTGKLLVD